MTDEQLVSACRLGDKEAWEQLYLRYKPRVRAVANRYYLNGFDDEDLIQEDMRGLCSAVIGFKEGSFSAYANACIRNAIIDTIKRVKNRTPDDPLFDVYPSDDDTESEIIGREMQSEFFRELKKQLSPLEFKVLTLYVEGFSSSEIKQRLSIDSKSVDNALTRAKHKIKLIKAEG